MRLSFFTALALIAFAANSLLARAALQNGDAGAAEFTLIRLISGAFILAALLASQKRPILTAGSWSGGLMLLLYAGAFSFAYLKLDTGTGALALFTAVQLTILSWAAFKTGLSKTEIAGSAMAFAGFIYLLLPAINMSALDVDSLSGFGLMVASGIGWGVYTIIGQSSQNPLAQTGGNFWRASLLALPLLIWIYPSHSLSLFGIGLAITSGAVTSALGYAIWYAVLPKLSSTLAATLQLLVPPLAALMGWSLLGEEMSLRLLVALIVISAGIGLVIRHRHPDSS